MARRGRPPKHWKERKADATQVRLSPEERFKMDALVWKWSMRDGKEWTASQILRALISGAVTEDTEKRYVEEMERVMSEPVVRRPNS